MCRGVLLGVSVRAGVRWCAAACMVRGRGAAGCAERCGGCGRWVCGGCGAEGTEREVVREDVARGVLLVCLRTCKTLFEGS